MAVFARFAGEVAGKAAGQCVFAADDFGHDLFYQNGARLVLPLGKGGADIAASAVLRASENISPGATSFSRA
jgi:hypothetical protein